ncbi:CCAAT- binding transcription factor component [Sorochytrium milnesiophthora]
MTTQTKRPRAASGGDKTGQAKRQRKTTGGAGSGKGKGKASAAAAAAAAAEESDDIDRQDVVDFVLPGNLAWYKSTKTTLKSTAYWPVVVFQADLLDDDCTVVWMHPKYVSCEKTPLSALRKWGGVKHAVYIQQGESIKQCDAEWKAVLAETQRFASAQDFKVLEERVHKANILKPAKKTQTTLKQSFGMADDSDNDLEDLSLTKKQPSTARQLSRTPQSAGRSRKSASQPDGDNSLSDLSSDEPESNDKDFVDDVLKRHRGHKQTKTQATLAVDRLHKSVAQQPPTVGRQMGISKKSSSFTSESLSSLKQSKLTIPAAGGPKSSHSRKHSADTDQHEVPRKAARIQRSLTDSMAFSKKYSAHPLDALAVWLTPLRSRSSENDVVLKGFLGRAASTSHAINLAYNAVDSDEEVGDDIDGLYVDERVLVAERTPSYPTSAVTYVPGLIVSLDDRKISVRRYNEPQPVEVDRSQVLTVSDSAGASVKFAPLGYMPDLTDVARAEQQELDENYINQDLVDKLQAVKPYLEAILDGAQESFRVTRFYSRTGGRDLYQYVGRGQWSKQDRDMVHRLLKEEYGPPPDAAGEPSASQSSMLSNEASSPRKTPPVSLTPCMDLSSPPTSPVRSSPQKSSQNTEPEVGRRTNLDSLSFLRRDAFVYLVLYPECLIRLSLLQQLPDETYILPPATAEQLAAADQALQEGHWPYTFLETIKRADELLRQRPPPLAQSPVQLSSNMNRPKATNGIIANILNSIDSSSSSSSSDFEDDPRDADYKTRTSKTPTTNTRKMSYISDAVQHQNQVIQQFWQNHINTLEQNEIDFKIHPLPLARIKKVMKSDHEVKQLMISSEAPLIFSKACELFIAELTLRAWLVAEENKRRTLQRSDIATAVGKSDQYDFLIDIVPREDPNGARKYPKFDMPMGEYLPPPGGVMPPAFLPMHDGQAAADVSYPPNAGPAGYYPPGPPPMPPSSAGPDAAQYVHPPPAMTVSGVSALMPMGTASSRHIMSGALHTTPAHPQMMPPMMSQTPTSEHQLAPSAAPNGSDMSTSAKQPE